MPTTHLRTCPLCDAMCGLAITVDGARIESIRGDPDDVFSHGHVCPKAAALRDLHEDPDRLRRPLRRTANGFVEVSWDEALDEAAERLAAIRNRHGERSVALYVGNPVTHHHTALLAMPALLGALGTRNRFDANSQDANAKMLACHAMFGDALSLTIPDVDRTRYMMMFGANPAASNGSTMALGDVRARMRGIRERGGKLVLFDPRRTESAGWCDEHHFVRPGGDAALALAMLHVLFDEGRIDVAALARRASGVETLQSLARACSPERAATRVGIDAATIARLAREFASAPSAIAYARVGVCQSELGVLSSWLIEALNVVTGNIDREGGMMFTNPAIDLAPIVRRLGASGFARWRSRVRALPEFAGALPSAVLREEIETPGEGQIRALVTYAGNPVLSTPNGPRLGEALDRLEFMVAIDFYRNDTTRRAHLILPPCGPLEHAHYDLAFNAVAVRNVAKYCEPVLAREPEARDDGEILMALAARIAARRMAGGWIGARVAPALERTLPSFDRMLDVLLRIGPHGRRTTGRAPLDLATLRASPHGIDLGPLEPQGRARIRTPSGRVNLAPEMMLESVRHLWQWLDRREHDALLLIGRRHLRSNNSWMHNLPTLVKGPSRSALWMHPADVERSGVEHGALVRVTSRVGSVVVRLHRTDDVMPGVVSLPHGFGHQASRETLRVAGALEGANVNALTDDAAVDPVMGNSILNGVPVTVAPP